MNWKDYFPDTIVEGGYHDDPANGRYGIPASEWSANQGQGDLSNYGSWDGDYLGYLNYMAEHGDPAALDKLGNYFFEQDARQWTADREDTQYQRLVEDLRKAGINPYILMQSGASPISSSASGQSGSQFSNYSINKEKNDQNWLKIFLSILPIAVAAIAMAL